MSPATPRLLTVCLAFALATMACTLGAPQPTALPSATPTLQVVVISSPTANNANNSATATIAPPNTAVPQTCVPSTAGAAYRVQAGDILSVLAARTNTSVEALVQANCLTNSNQIAVGQIIYLPRVPATVTPSATVVDGFMNTVQVVRSEGTNPLDRYVNANVTVTLAVDITNLTNVTFFATEQGHGTTTLGTSANPVSPATVVWQVPNKPGLTLFLWAQGRRADGAMVQTPKMTSVTIVAPPVSDVPPPISRVAISPSEGQTSDTRIVRVGKTVTIIVDNITSGSSVTFYAEDPGVGKTLLGISANPLNVATLLWEVPNTPDKDLFLYVVIALPDGRKVQTGAMTVRILK